VLIAILNLAFWQRIFSSVSQLLVNCFLLSIQFVLLHKIGIKNRFKSFEQPFGFARLSIDHFTRICAFDWMCRKISYDSDVMQSFRNERRISGIVQHLLYLIM